jgi:hypothetical protein
MATILIPAARIRTVALRRCQTIHRRPADGAPTRNLSAAGFAEVSEAHTRTTRALATQR